MTEGSPIEWIDKTAFLMPLLPAELRIDPVLAGLVHCMAFLELSGDEAVDPSWAVEAMEHVAAYLQRLSEPEAAAIAIQLHRISGHVRANGGSPEAISFIDQLLASCGVMGEWKP